jgi:hypothetical protein
MVGLALITLSPVGSEAVRKAEHLRSAKLKRHYDRGIAHQAIGLSP